MPTVDLAVLWQATKLAAPQHPQWHSASGPSSASSCLDALPFAKRATEKDVNACAPTSRGAAIAYRSRSSTPRSSGDAAAATDAAKASTPDGTRAAAM
eukprot:scaffold40600_cov62-Phaeocystis_antarctica.AAC.2